MLFGEHAVVYDHPCIVTAVDQRMFVTVKSTKTGNFVLNAPDVLISNYSKPLERVGKGEIPKGAQFIEAALKNTLKTFIYFTKIELTTIEKYKLHPLSNSA